jgi:hypothetical protein
MTCSRSRLPSGKKTLTWPARNAARIASGDPWIEPTTTWLSFFMSEISTLS